MNNIKFMVCTLCMCLAVGFAFAVDSIQINSVTGAWSNPVGGQNLSGVGTNTIMWGGTTSTERSGYQFIGNAPPSFFPVVGQAFDLGTFTHFNEPIPLNSAITAVTLTTSMNLAINGVMENLNFVYNFNHNETPNVPGTCPAGSVSVCDDIVTFVNNVPKSDTFTIGGKQFTIELTGFLFNGNLASSFLTQENKTNTAVLEAIITEVSVPEPSTYLLMGIPLVIALFLKQRQKAAQKTTVSK